MSGVSQGFVSVPVDGHDAYIVRSQSFGKFFTLRWREGGKYKYRSLKTRNYARAMATAKGLMTKIERGLYPDANTNFEDAFEDYMRQLTCGVMRRQQISGIHYKHFLPYFKRIEVTTMTTAKWEAYKSHRLDKVRQEEGSVRFKTLHHERALMKAFLRYCVRMCLIPSLPEITAFNKHLKVVESVKQRGAAYEDHELAEVFDILRERADESSVFGMEPYYAKALYSYCLVLFLSVGRAGEIRQLKVSDIEFKDDNALITIQGETSKVKKRRKTAIPSSAAKVLKDFIDWSASKRPKGGHVFYNYNHPRSVVKYINQTFKRVMTEAGLYHNESGTARPVSSLRNTAITMLAQRVEQAFLVSVAGTSARMLNQHYFDRRAEQITGYTEDIADALVMSGAAKTL